MAKQPGIFCLEGDWQPKLTDRTSVEPQLRMLENMNWCQPVIRRDVATKEEFHYYIQKWLQKQYSSYTLGYLAFHGERGRINLGRDSIELADISEKYPLKFAGKIVYFGSCATMSVDETMLQDFCRRTGAKAICGYTKDVDWLRAAAFDFVLLPELLSSGYLMSTYTRLDRLHGGFVRELGFRISTAKDTSPRRHAQNALK